MHRPPFNSGSFPEGLSGGRSGEIALVRPSARPFSELFQNFQADSRSRAFHNPLSRLTFEGSRKSVPLCLLF
jgi:hypothetical protein